MQFIFVKNMHTHYHIQFEFFMFFLGIFISKYLHAVILHNEYAYTLPYTIWVFYVFFGFFYFQIFPCSHFT